MDTAALGCCVPDEGSLRTAPRRAQQQSRARRWSLRILWELRNGPLTFRGLREACDDVSPSSLNQRLADLRELGVVECRGEGYELTSSGQELGRILLASRRASS
jgi:DNA-binding HxlR family transcriptional regulator